METKRNYFGLWKGIMVGSFLGAAAGILMAPKSGKELRSEIKERTNKALDETRHFYADGRTKLADGCTKLLADGCTKLNDKLARFCGRNEKVSASRMESPEDMVADA